MVLMFASKIWALGKFKKIHIHKPPYHLYSVRLLSTAIIRSEDAIVCISFINGIVLSIPGKINTNKRTHMYLSRLFILFHFNIAIVVIAVVKFVCCLYHFHPSEFSNSCATDVMSKCPRRKSDAKQKFRCFYNTAHNICVRNYDYLIRWEWRWRRYAELCVKWYKSGFLFSTYELNRRRKIMQKYILSPNM